MYALWDGAYVYGLGLKCHRVLLGAGAYPSFGGAWNCIGESDPRMRVWKRQWCAWHGQAVKRLWVQMATGCIAWPQVN